MISHASLAISQREIRLNSSGDMTMKTDLGLSYSNYTH